MTQQEFFARYSYNPANDKLGGGSFGKVYKAYDTVLDKFVAIKVAEQMEAGGKTFSLLDEFKALENLPDHANIAKYEQLYTYESPQGVFDYAVMQYYPDGNLSQLISNQSLTLEQKEHLALQLLEGIGFLHSYKVVHRDLKPSNILIHKRRLGGDVAYIPKITDFGLSKKAHGRQDSRFTNSIGAGTYAYSSPEQLKAEELRLNTDWWSYGVIVYEVFTGKQMFQVTKISTGSSAMDVREILDNILKSDITNKIKELPEKWQAVVTACLQRNANKRVKTAEKIKAILNGIDFLEKQEGTKIIDDEKTVIDPTPNPQPKVLQRNQEQLKENTNNLGRSVAIGVVAVLLCVFFIWKMNSSVVSRIEQTDSNVDSTLINESDERKVLNITRMSIDKSVKSKYGKNIKFKANLLTFTDITNNKVLNYIYKDLLEDKSKFDVTKNNFKSVLNNLADNFIQSNREHGKEDYEYGTSSAWNMKIIFANKHFLCVEVRESVDTGTGTGAGVWANIFYRNVNYNTGEIVKLSDIVNPDVLTEELLYQCFKNYARDSGDGSVDINGVGRLYYPDEFTFDKESILFVYPKYAVGAGSLGNITFKIPFWEIENGLQPDFKRMIDDSQTIGININ